MKPSLQPSSVRAGVHDVAITPVESWEDKYGKGNSNTTFNSTKAISKQVTITLTQKLKSLHCGEVARHLLVQLLHGAHLPLFVHLDVDCRFKEEVLDSCYLRHLSKGIPACSERSSCITILPLEYMDDFVHAVTPIVQSYIPLPLSPSTILIQSIKVCSSTSIHGTTWDKLSHKFSAFVLCLSVPPGQR